MIKDVFVIGAGASVPYGFPTGFELLQEIKSQSPHNLPMNLLTQMFKVYYGKVGDVKGNNQLKCKIVEDINANILDSLKDSCILSIDQYLKNHRDDENVQNILKMLIAHNILSCEKTAYDWRFSKKEDIKHLGKIDWIQHLITKIDLYFKNKDQLLNYLNSTTFISFNYDRVLEYFLFNYLVNDRKFESTEANNIISELGIFHINGHIGELNIIPFGAEDVKYFDVIKNMRTVWDERKDKDKLLTGDVKRLIKESKRIFVLGTSYIPDNNKAIGLLKDSANGKQFSGTGLGLSTANISRVENNLGLNLGTITNDDGENPIRKINALDLINDAFVL